MYLLPIDRSLNSDFALLPLDSSQDNHLSINENVLRETQIR